SAEHSETAVKKLSSTADDLGDRLFGAINLLQASGKVLAEQTEKTQSRIDEAIDKLKDIPAVVAPPAPEPAAPAFASDTAPRLEALIASLEAGHKKLEELVSEQTQAAKVQIDLLMTHSTGLLSQSTTTAQTLSAAADHIREGQAKFDATV